MKSKTLIDYLKKQLPKLVESGVLSCLESAMDFEIDIPEPDEGCQNNLHLSAHLRQDDRPGRYDEPEPNI